MAIAGTIILYNPNINEVIRNVKTYLFKIEKLYVIDNSDKDNSEFFTFSEKIVYNANRNNLGIAKALNQAVCSAANDGFSHLLTMDQDSFFSKESITEYANIFNKLDSFSESAVIGISPKIFDKNKKPIINSNYEKVNLVITSGSIINLNIHKKLEGFNENLFIDCVDYDYCLRSILLGYSVIRFKNIILYHVGGVPKFFLGIHVGMYPPERLYFMARNSLYWWRRYYKHFPILVIKNIVFNFIFSFLPNILFSKNKSKSLKSILRGFKGYKSLF